MDFSKAPEPSPGGGILIPEGTLIGGVIKLKPTGTGSLIHRNDNSGNQFFKATIEVLTPPYKGARVFDIIGVDGSDGLMQMSDIKIKAILETNGAGPTNPQGYVIQNRSEINGKRVACKVKVSTNGDKPVNEIDTYLSPIASTTKDDFERLNRGDVHPPDPMQTQIPGATRITPPATSATDVTNREAPMGALPPASQGHPPPQDEPPGWLTEPERAGAV